MKDKPKVSAKQLTPQKPKTLVSSITNALRAKAALNYAGAAVCLVFSIVLVLVGIREFTKLAIFIPKEFPIASGNIDSNNLLSQLISMQSNTLAVVSIAIAIAATILSVLSILQWKRSEDIRKQYQNTNERVQNFFAMAVVQSLSEEKYYVQADKLLAEELQQIQSLVSEDKEMLLFSSIQILLAKEKDAKIVSRKQDLSDDAIEAWTSVAMICSEILNIRYAFTAICYLVKIKYVYAKYQLCRLVRQTDRKIALEHICDANRMLQKISESELDPYGHINNLRGLVYLWMCKCQEDYEEYGKGAEYAKKYEKAEQYFINSLNDAKQMDPQSDFSTFYNHVGVAQINRARCLLFEGDEFKEESQKILMAANQTFTLLIKQKPSYAKAYLNMAHICYLKILNKVGITYPVFLLQDIELWAGKPENSVHMNSLIGLINNEKRLLNESHQRGETLPDIGYRMFEILTIELVIRKTCPKYADILSSVPCKIMNDTGLDLEGDCQVDNISPNSASENVIDTKQIIIENSVSKTTSWKNRVLTRTITKKEVSNPSLQSNNRPGGCCKVHTCISEEDVEKVLVSILKKYKLIDTTANSLENLKTAPLATEDPYIGFLEPWRNYAFWKSMKTVGPERTLWKDTAFNLNKQIANQREKKAKAWEKRARELIS